MWLYLGNEWNWRWCCRWGIQCKELPDSNCETTAEEYIDFDIKTCSSVPVINSDTVDQRVSSVQKMCGWISPQRIWKRWYRSRLSDDDDVGVGNAKVEAEVHEITTCKVLTLLDKPVNLKELNKDERASLSSIKDRLEIIRVKNKKQWPIKDFM